MTVLFVNKKNQKNFVKLRSTLVCRNPYLLANGVGAPKGIAPTRCAKCVATGGLECASILESLLVPLFFRKGAVPYSTMINKTNILWNIGVAGGVG